MKEKLILTKDEHVMYPIEIINNEYLAYTESGSIGNGDASTSIIYLQNLNNGDKVVLANGEDYSSPKSVCYGGKMYITFTGYNQGEKYAYLLKCDGQVKEEEVCVVSIGKIDNIAVTVHDNKLYICWESYSDGGTKILMKSIGIDEPIGNFKAEDEICVTKSWENAYRPAMISDGSYLYIAYESFFYSRYHILLRAVDNGVISEALDVGSNKNNDQKHSVAIRDGRVIVVFENSWPLYKGYKWQDKVIMPAFGHGWKVETTMGMANVKYDNGYFDIKRLGGGECNVPTILPNETKSAGCPYVYVDEKGVIYVSFVEWINDEYGRRWETRIKYYNGQKWVTFEKNRIGQLQRVNSKLVINENQDSLKLAGIRFTHKLRDIGEWSQNNSGMISAINEFPMPKITDVKGYQWVNETPRIVNDVETIKNEKYEIQGIEGNKKLYWGDLHMHTNISGCSLRDTFHCVEIEDKYRFCKDVAQLDFAMITDHETMHFQEWVRTKNAAEAATIPGEFVAFQGFEWTCTHHSDKINFGHYNVLYKGTGPLLRISESNADRVDKVWDILKDNDCLTIPHHPSESTHMLNWEYFNEDMETLVEIFQVRGSYEYDNCEMNPSHYGRSYSRNASVRYGLNLGYKFGFTSGGEHEGVGVTGVYADELSREGIYNALKNRHTYGTTGDRIILEFRANGQLMGSDLGNVTGDVEITAKVIGTDMIEYIYIVKDGKEIIRLEGTSKDMEITWKDLGKNVEVGHHYYYIGVKQKNDEMAWGSPVFLEKCYEK